MTKIFLRLIMFASFAILVGCANHEKKRIENANKYLESRTDISETVRSSILNGKVLIGMFPDEAYAAAGAFTYTVERDPKWESGAFPPEIIFGQREKPDASKISMTFCNKTQFDSKTPIVFTVYFEQGKAIRIEPKAKK